MNWALIDTGTFDYAADAWGYSYGATAEWYQGDWTVRGGVFDLSTVPNGTTWTRTSASSNGSARSSGATSCGAIPARSRSPDFSPAARIGTYEDAIALAAVTGGPADIAAVRQYRSRGGVGVNLEQEITADLGLFARAGLGGRQHRAVCLHRHRSHRRGGLVAERQAVGPPGRHRSA